MKIHTPTAFNYIKTNTTFKQNEWQVFGIDKTGEEKRDYIRQWHYEHYLPYQSIYEKEKKLSEYELKELLKQFNKKTTFLNNETLSKIGLYNLEQLGDSNSARGAMVRGYQTYKLDLLKDAGIQRIASLMKDPSLEEECIKRNMEYFYFDINQNAPCFEDKTSVENKSKSFWLNIANIKDETVLKEYVKKDIASWEENTRETIKKITDFINFMQKDNVYIGCACGTYRTDFAVTLDSLFNPKAKHSFDLSSFTCPLKSLENLFANLTIKDKVKLGWVKDFEEIFLSKINKLKI